MAISSTEDSVEDDAGLLPEQDVPQVPIGWRWSPHAGPLLLLLVAAGACVAFWKRGGGLGGALREASEAASREPEAVARVLNTVNPYPVVVTAKDIHPTEKFSKQKDGTGSSRVAFKTSHGKFLTCQRDGRITGDAPSPEAWQIFHESTNPDGSKAIRAWTGKYVTAFPNGNLKAYSSLISSWERFDEIDNGDGTVSFYNVAHKRYWSAITYDESTADEVSMQSEFDKIYKNNFWQYGSGYGSLPKNTVGYRQYVQDFMRDRGIKTVVDVGCGDWQFSRLMDWSGVKYLGIDIARSVIDEDNARYANGTDIRFRVGSATKPLPAADLLIIREVLQHVPLAAIYKFLNLNALTHKYHYVLITDEKTGQGEMNTDTLPGGQVPARGVDLSAAPFSLDGLEEVYSHLQIQTVLLTHENYQAVRPEEFIKEGGEAPSSMPTSQKNETKADAKEGKEKDDETIIDVPPLPCVDSGEDCRESRCCSASGESCFRKNAGWAACKSTCSPGKVDQEDMIRVRTPWSCDVLNQCGGLGEDCRFSRCCRNPEFKCFVKNVEWAACKSSCTPGELDSEDHEGVRTPWACELLEDDGLAF